MTLNEHDDSQLSTGHDEEEQTALLRGSAVEPPPSLQLSAPKQRLKWLTWILVATLVLTFEMGNAMRIAPLVASYEGIICDDAARTTVELSYTCLEDHAVKNELALILGVSQFLDCLPTLLLSGFYGNMADKYGRRPVLLLGYLGMVLSATWMTCVVWLAPTIPLRLVWLGSIFTLIGGGPGVPISILMTTATDVVASTQRVLVFSFIHGTSLLAVIIGSSISSVAMTSTGNDMPLVIGLSLMCLALLLSFFLPNTAQKPRRLSATFPNTTSLGSVGHSIDSTRQTTATMIWQTRGAIPVLIAGFLSMLGQQVQILILQYMPQAFGISLAKANAFNVLNNVINLLILFLILPHGSKLLSHYYARSTFSRDLALAHISGMLFIAGALVLGFAPDVVIAAIGIIIFGTGVGLSSVLRAIFVELFPPEHATFATTLISAAKTIGGSLSGPIYSSAFAWSLGLKVVLQGLPFFISAACFVIVELVLITARLKAGEDSD